MKIADPEENSTLRRKFEEISTNIPKSPSLEVSFFAKVLRNIKNRNGQENDASRGYAPETIVTSAHQQPKMCLTPIATKIPGTIPKPSLNLEAKTMTHYEAAVDKSHVNMNSPAVSFLKNGGRSLEQTPRAASSFQVLVPNCPSTRRTFARTPHAEEQAQRELKERNNDAYNCTIDESGILLAKSQDNGSVASAVENITVTTEPLSRVRPALGENHHLTDSMQTFHRFCRRIQNSKAVAQGSQSKECDYSRNVLPVLHEINVMYIDEDMKRVGCRHITTNCQLASKKDAKKHTELTFKENEERKNKHNSHTNHADKFKEFLARQVFAEPRTSTNSLSTKSNSHNDNNNRNYGSEKLANHSSSNGKAEKEGSTVVDRLCLTDASAFKRLITVDASRPIRYRKDTDKKAFPELPFSHYQHHNQSLLDREVTFYNRYSEFTERLGIRKIEGRDCRDPVAHVLQEGDDYVSLCY